MAVARFPSGLSWLMEPTKICQFTRVLWMTEPKADSIHASSGAVPPIATTYTEIVQKEVSAPSDTQCSGQNRCVQKLRVHHVRTKCKPITASGLSASG